jgi:uncharacterized protein (DUF2141 family)
MTMIELAKRKVGFGMKSPGLVLAALLAGSAGAAGAQDCTGRPGPVRLYVDVEGVRASRGLIAVSLYADDRSRFLARRGALYVGRVPARQGRTRVCIHLPSTGIWALAVYHDEDSNRSFTRSGLGLPREGYGFSNNAPALLGLPAFRRVRMQVPRNNLATSIRLRYP